MSSTYIFTILNSISLRGLVSQKLTIIIIMTIIYIIVIEISTIIIRVPQIKLRMKLVVSSLTILVAINLHGPSR